MVEHPTLRCQPDGLCGYANKRGKPKSNEVKAGKGMNILCQP